MVDKAVLIARMQKGEEAAEVLSKIKPYADKVIADLTDELVTEGDEQRRNQVWHKLNGLISVISHITSEITSGKIAADQYKREK